MFHSLNDLSVFVYLIKIKHTRSTISSYLVHRIAYNYEYYEKFSLYTLDCINSIRSLSVSCKQLLSVVIT